MRVEILNNFHVFKKLSGNPVTVGSVIELQHLLSKKYLGIDINFSHQSGKDYLKFNLQDIPNNNTIVKIEAIFNFQKEKMKLMNGDKVHIEV